MGDSAMLLDCRDASEITDSDRAWLAAMGERPEREVDDDVLVDRWEGLLTGRWTIVRTQAVGARIRFIALENPGGGSPLRGLSDRERTVVERISRGASNKVIAIDLGLGESAVAMILARALRKLGVERREHLPCLAAALARRAAP